MNEFEKRRTELRLQFKGEQRQITKDCYRTIGRLNHAIAKVDSIEAREALRAERERVYESMRRSHEFNKTCYLELLDMLNDEQSRHYEKNPSNRKIRRLMARLCQDAELKGDKTLILAFGDNRHCKITFD